MCICEHATQATSVNTRDSYLGQFNVPGSAANMSAIKTLRGGRSALSSLSNYLWNTNNISITRSVTSQPTIEDVLTLEIQGEALRFPHVWLRDNCQCEQCFHPSAKSRILDWSNFDLNRKPVDVRRDEVSVKVTWDDGHTSQYRLGWLKFRSFTAKHQKIYNNELYKPKKTSWVGEQFKQICKYHDYNDILGSDEALYRWLRDLAIYGVTVVGNTPDDVDSIEPIVRRVGFPKQTHYGIRFVVESVRNTSNVAYLSSNLQMHTDLPYYQYCPGVNLLHYLVQTKSNGGENTLSDCHFIAEYMKEHHPAEYKTLTETDVEWSDVGIEHGNEFHKLYRSPVICLDKYGEVSRINFSIPQRGSHFPGPIQQVKPWYEAHSLFYQLNQRFSAKFKVDAGSILVFDNIRLLHGRNQYEDREHNVRKLVGVYIDWDEIYSRLRSLKVKLEKTKWY